MGERHEEYIIGENGNDFLRRSRQWRGSCGKERWNAEREQETGTVVMEHTG